MRLRHLLHAAIVLASVSFAGAAFADTPQEFLRHEHEKITVLLRQPASADRDTRIGALLQNSIDYEELTHRAFGEPCPSDEPSCTNYWAQLSEDQKTEVRGLFQRLVKKSYQKNLMKTLDYDVAYRDQGDSGASRVRTEAKHKTNARAPAVQVDYIMRSNGSAYRIVDILPERSSLTKHYYDQFDRFMRDPAKGYPEIVKKLNGAINKT
jgi:phospholipid transport system substrate-binding protein